MSGSRSLAPAAAVLLAALAVLGCQPKRGNPPVADGTNAGKAAAHAASAEATEGTRTARLPGDGAAAGETRSGDAQTADALALQPIDTNPQRMLGADAEGLAARLGEPARRRREAAAQVWQYRLQTCVLDVVLYPENGTPVIAHLDARDRQGAPVATRGCLRRLLERRAAAQSAGGDR